MAVHDVLHAASLFPRKIASHQDQERRLRWQRASRQAAHERGQWGAGAGGWGGGGGGTDPP